MPEDCNFDIHWCNNLSSYIEQTTNAVKLTILFIYF